MKSSYSEDLSDLPKFAFPNYIPFDEIADKFGTYALFVADDGDHILSYVEVGTNGKFVSVLFSILNKPKFTIYTDLEEDKVYFYDFKRDSLSNVVGDKDLLDLLEMVYHPLQFFGFYDYIIKERDEDSALYVGYPMDNLDYIGSVDDSFFYEMIDKSNIIIKNLRSGNGEFDPNDVVGGKLLVDGNKSTLDGLIAEYLESIDEENILILSQDSMKLLRVCDNDLMIGIVIDEFDLRRIPSNYKISDDYSDFWIKYFDEILKEFLVKYDT